MKKSILAIIALFLVLFTAAGVFTASATSENDATTTTDGYYCSTLPVSSEFCPTTIVTEYLVYCTECNKGFESEEALTNHYPCSGETTNNYTTYDILKMIVDLAKAETSQWDDIESAANRISDLLGKVKNGSVTKDDFDDAIADLEAALADIDFEQKDELIETLKIKIEVMYAGEDETIAPEWTTDPNAPPPADTGDEGSPTTNTDAPSFATGTDTDCDCSESIWDIIGGWLEKIADFFRNIFEIIC